MTFLTSIYGKDYIPFMTVCLESLERTHSNDKIYILYEDIPDYEVLIHKSLYKNVKFIPHKNKKGYIELNKRIPAKLDYYCDEIKKFEDGELICIIDIDTLIYKNISPIVKNDFDFLYTWSNKGFYLNTGVFIIKKSKKIIEFMKKWRDRALEIIEDPVLLTQSIKVLGAADQFSLGELISKLSYKKGGTINFDFGDIKFEAVECNILNQIYSVPLNKGSYILHYKSGWRTILLNESGYTIRRTQKDSEEMHALWDEYYYDANEKLLKNFVFTTIDKYLNKINWEKFCHENHSILNSEMLSVLSTADSLNIDLIIESVGYDRQSTKILADFFNNSRTKIISIEPLKNRVAKDTENKLKKYKNLRVLYGDSYKLIPEIIKKYKNYRIAILMSNRDGNSSYNTFQKSLKYNNNIVVGLFHDCRKSYRKIINHSREDIYNYFDRLFFTDDFDYVKKTSILDENIEKSNFKYWKPYHKDFIRTGSYGPTLGIALVTSRDINRSNIKYTNKYVEKFKHKFPRISKLFVQLFH